MRRTLACFIAFIASVLLAAGLCFAEQPAGPGQAEHVTGTIDGRSVDSEKKVTYHCIIQPETDHDFVLIAFEGSRMDPRQKGNGVIWTEGLDRFDVVDFSIADELCAWQKKKWENVCNLYSAAVVDVLREQFGDVKTVGIYAFSKGASAADCVCRTLRESGINVAFVWLNDAFTTHGLPYVTELTENGEILLYNRYSKDERVNQLSKKLHKNCSDLPNVDSRHIRSSHGGLIKYGSFPDELADAVMKASFVR